MIDSILSLLMYYFKNSRKESGHSTIYFSEKDFKNPLSRIEVFDSTLKKKNNSDFVFQDILAPNNYPD